jgi:hypothetical protein
VRLSVASCDTVWQHLYKRLWLSGDDDQQQQLLLPPYWKQRVHRALQMSDDVVLL